MRLAGAVDRLQDLRAAGADEPREADDLAGPHLEVEGCELALAGEPFDLQHGFGRGRPGRPLGEDVLDVAARHQRHHLAGRRRLGGEPARDGPAVLEDGDPVADAADLLQAVRDVDDGDTVGGEVGDDAEEVVDLVRVERGGRLVHHDQPYVVRERPRHGHDLLLRRRQVPDQPPGVDLGMAEPLEQRGRRRLGRPSPYDEAGGRRFVAEVDVLGDRQVLHQVEFLVDGGDAQAHGGDGRAQGDVLPAPADGAGVGLVGAGQHLDEGGLPGAVLAEEAVHLTGLDLEVDAVEGPDSGERLGDAGHAEQRWFWCHVRSPRRACGPVSGQSRAGRCGAGWAEHGAGSGGTGHSGVERCAGRTCGAVESGDAKRCLRG